ncbi:MAG TPA: hypothetical protein VJ787_04510 [Thermoleophilia bacterium]|nr:hypothetical protein [Thermoleophilia bacterium]
MATITESIEVDVPLEYADRQWTEYLFKSMYRAYANDPAGTSQKLDAEACNVRFATEDEQLVSVTVECQYRPHSERDSGAEIGHVQDQLKRDLREYREFVLGRCEKDSCR